MRDPGTHSLMYDVFIKTLPSGLREFCGQGSRKSVRANRDRRYKGNKTLKP